MFIKRVKIDLSYDPAIPLLVIYPKDWKTHTRKDVCIPMLIAALFKEFQDMEATEVSYNRCLDTEALVYIYTTEYYSAIRRDEIPPFVTKRADLEKITLREISQTEKVLVIV